MKNTIRKVCLLDLKTILDKQKAEVYTLIENRKSNPVDIAIDESRLYQINHEIAKYITINYNMDK